jgi:hypothetical protein
MLNDAGQPPNETTSVPVQAAVLVKAKYLFLAVYAEGACYTITSNPNPYGVKGYAMFP